MIGIYKITNLINQKIYIGQSINIQERWTEHIRESNVSEEIWEANKRKEQTHLHRAIRKYGSNNFSFEIIEECTEAELNNRERYWIAHYNTFNSPNGYNMTAGGDGLRGRTGELSTNHKLNLQEVMFIKEKLRERWTAQQIQEYVPAASDGMISSINYGKTWRTQEEKYPISINNGHRKWSDEEAMEIKIKYANGTSIHELSVEYEAAADTISRLVNGKTYTNLPVLERQVQWKREASSIRRFSDEEVRKYRRQVYTDGLSILNVFNSIENCPCGYSAFYNMIKRKTYKDVSDDTNL